MGKNRLEAFSDGVIAIIITIMVLELKVPHGANFAVLVPLWPVFMSYILSFIYVGIYWNKLQYQNYPMIRINQKCCNVRPATPVTGIEVGPASSSSNYLSRTSVPE
jgi:uncharacterized membrane protein